MSGIDWVVVALFLAAVVAVGIWFSRRASGSLEDFFVSGRNLPWWLAGTSILATSFASDTPLHVTRVIREGGLGAAWFYWSGILAGLLVAFFFARLWRRAEIVTDAELIELRYSGRPALALRTTIALFRSVVLELITLAWVILGMAKVAKTVLVLPPVVELPALGPVRAEEAVVVVLVLIALGYSVTSGLWGVVVTDFIEFIVAMGGAVLLAVLAVKHAGGVTAMKEAIAASSLGEGALVFLPRPGEVQLPTVSIVVYIGVTWWANTEIDGSGKRAQRFLACRNETHALASGLWNMAVQWILRSWPWYLTALASLVILPEVADHETVYPRLIAELLPAGLKGLMVASFLAAFLSTVDSQLNLSASYLVNDLYKRLIARQRPARHYVTASRLTVVALAAVATVLALAMPSVLGAFRFKMELMAGLGLVYVLRWFWWRVSAWTEIAALGAGIATTATLHLSGAFAGLPADAAFAWRLLCIVGCSLVAALAATLVLPHEPIDHLKLFCERVRPPPLLWRAVTGKSAARETSELGRTALQWLLAVVSVFCAMFSLGKLLLAEPGSGLLRGGIAVASAWVLMRWLFGRGSGAPRT